MNTGDVAGVPYVVVPPDSGARPDAPVVVGWHLLDSPRSETAFHAALPLAGLDAWRIYLGLPLSGARLPAGGFDELMRLGAEDAVRHVYEPVNSGGADEFEPTLAALGERFGFGGGPLGVFGGSAGGGVAAEVMTRRSDVGAAVLINPALQLRVLVGMLGREFGITYSWDETTDAIAARMDYVARAGELGTTPVRAIVGADDDAEVILDPVAALVAAVAGPADVITVPDMAHALAEEPGLEPAPQTAHAAVVDKHAVAWFQQHLRG